jgi:repressor LexA
MNELSDRQRQVLQYIRDTVAARGYPPSVREIGEAVGLSSPSTVHSHLNSLVSAGALRRDATKPRAIVVIDEVSAPSVEPDRIRIIPLVGRIAAGTPILADEQIDDHIPLPVDLTGEGRVMLLEVHGDSMTGAGILDGDLVAVRLQADAEEGEIVAVLVEGEEATVKRLRRRQGKVILESENPAFEPMVFDGGVEMVGKVVSVMRRVR